MEQLCRNFYDFENFGPEISHQGEGIIHKLRAFEGGHFQSPIDFIDFVKMARGTSIGRHKHGANEEIYFFLGGQGEMTINDEKFDVKSGDLIVNPCFGEHELINKSEQDILILIFQVSLKK